MISEGLGGMGWSLRETTQFFNSKNTFVNYFQTEPSQLHLLNCYIEARTIYKVYVRNVADWLDC